MCAPMFVVAGMMVVGALTSAQAAKQASQSQQALYGYQAGQAEVVAAHEAAVERNRATVAEYQAKDAIARGQTAQTQQQLKTAALTGHQTARFAAAGLDVKEGSAFNVLMDTKFMGKTDELTIADNAAKEAWAYRESARTGMSNAAFLQSQGQSNASFLRSRAAAEDPGRSFVTSLLGSAGNVAASWYGMSQGTRGASPLTATTSRFSE